jgi:hypothetical protein
MTANETENFVWTDSDTGKTYAAHSSPPAAAAAAAPPQVSGQVTDAVAAPAAPATPASRVEIDPAHEGDARAADGGAEAVPFDPGSHSL